MSRLVCMTGSAADRAAAGLKEQHAALFAGRFPQRFLSRVTVPEEPALPDFARAAVPIGEGGLWAALWKLGEAEQTGFCVDAAAIPLRQETEEICEVLELDPYSLPSSGHVFFCEAQEVLESLEREMDAARFTVIGHTTKAAARTLKTGDRIRYLNRSAE